MHYQELHVHDRDHVIWKRDCSLPNAGWLPGDNFYLARTLAGLFEPHFSYNSWYLYLPYNIYKGTLCFVRPTFLIFAQLLLPDEPLRQIFIFLSNYQIGVFLYSSPTSPQVRYTFCKILTLTLNVLAPITGSTVIIWNL